MIYRATHRMTPNIGSIYFKQMQELCADNAATVSLFLSHKCFHPLRLTIFGIENGSESRGEAIIGKCRECITKIPKIFPSTRSQNFLFWSFRYKPQKGRAMNTAESAQRQSFTTTDPNFIHRILQTRKHIAYVGMMNPRCVGFRAFFTMLGLRHFTPGTPADTDYILSYVEVSEIIYGMVIIPSVNIPDAEAILKELSLRAVRGAPKPVSSQGGLQRVKKFPFDRNVWTVENIPGNKAYSADPAKNLNAVDVENAVCDHLIEENKKQRQAMIT